MCSKHFTRECFKNWTEHEMGFVRYLSLTDNAVPSVYTVGTSQSLTVSYNQTLEALNIMITTYRAANMLIKVNKCCCFF